MQMTQIGSIDSGGLLLYPEDSTNAIPKCDGQLDHGEASFTPANRDERDRDVTRQRPLVAVVDDNESVRESLPDLLQDSGFDVQTFASAEAFLQSPSVDKTSCLVLDVGLPGMSGPDLQLELTRRGLRIPIVFITAQGDKSLRPRLISRGAAACLFKPFSDTALIDAVSGALGTS
jgi:FixJ family two-component response regulator